MSKLEAIISRKRSSSPCQLATKRSINSKNGSDQFLLRPQFVFPIETSVLNFSAGRLGNSINGQQTLEEVESVPTPANFATGIPRAAASTQKTAPVHLDVGGTSYTTTLETLTKHPDSKLAKLFSGGIPVALDSLKQTYFLDRDGPSFRHVLNFLRNGELNLPDDFQALDILEVEARYFGLDEMLESIGQLRQWKAAVNIVSSGIAKRFQSNHAEVILLHLDRENSLDKESDDGQEARQEEKLYLTGSTDVLKDIFPEFSIAHHPQTSKGASTDANSEKYVHRATLTKPVPITEALRRFAEQGFAIYSTCSIQSPNLKKHTIEYALLSKNR